MYADDTLIIFRSKDIQIITADVQNALNKMFTWCYVNKLRISLSKTIHLTVQHIKPDLEPAVYVNNNHISTVKNYEYLGMILDNKLAINEHIDNMWKKANSKVAILAR